MKNGELILLPGSYVETKDTKGRSTLEQRMRRVMRKAGYPTFNCEDDDCEQPNLCDTLALAGCDGDGGDGHPAASLTNNNAAFSWNALTQVGNIPRTSTLVNNGNGTYTFTPGNGGAAVVIAATSVVTVSDSTSIDFSISGAGTSGSPYVITGLVKLATGEGNILQSLPTGLSLTCEDLAACGFISSTSVENGLEVVVDKVHLGGPLIKDTVVDGAGAFDMRFEALDGFSVDVASSGTATSRINLSRSLSLPAEVSQSDSLTPTTQARLLLDGDGSQTRLEQKTATQSSGFYCPSAAGSEHRVVDGTQTTRAVAASDSYSITSTDSGSTVYSQIYEDPAGAFIRSFDTANNANAQWLAEPDSAWGFVENSTSTPDGFTEVRLDADYARLGWTPDKNAGADGSEFEVRKVTGSSVDWATLITGLPTYATNAAAVSDSRPVDSLYKITEAGRTLIAIVV